MTTRHHGTEGRTRGAIAAGVIGGLLLALTTTSSMQSFEERAQGIVLGILGPKAWHPDVLVISVNDSTLRQLHWPVPRDVYALVVDAARRAGARAVAFDIFFAQPSDDPDEDEALAAASAQFRHTVFAVECARDEGLAGKTSGAGPHQMPARECHNFVPPAGRLAEVARLAHVQSMGTASGGFLGQYVFAESGAQRLPTLALAAWLEGQDNPPSSEERSELTVGALKIPVDAAGGLRASYRGGLTAKNQLGLDTLAAALRDAPLDGPLPAIAASLQGKYLLVGQTASGIGDRGALITGEDAPLVALHGALLSDLLEGRPMQVTPPWLARLLVVLFALLAWGAAFGLRPWAAPLAMVGSLAGLFGGALLLADRSVLLSIVAPSVSGLLVFGAALGIRLGAQEQERRMLRAAFGAYVDPAVLDRLLDNPGYLKLGGARLTLTVLFSDIKGYSSMTNQLPAEELVKLLREYLEVMTRLVKNREGRVDKIMGDGIMAVFGDPIPHADHALRAVEVGLEMQQSVARLTKKWAEEGRAGLAIRVGIATGEVFVGNVGSAASKIEYTVLGAAVNLAARLEGKAPSGGVLVSRETYDALATTFEFLPVSGLELKGFEGTYEAFLCTGQRRSEDPQRVAPRLPTHAEVRLRARGEEHPAKVLEVSSGGLFLVSALSLTAGEVVEVEFPPTPRVNESTRVVVHGEVKHVRAMEGGTGAGLKIAHADSASSASLKHFVALYLSDAAWVEVEHLEGARVKLADVARGEE